MLTIADGIQFQPRYRNERDVEHPLVVEFLKAAVRSQTSLVDVGAHYSHATYAPDVRATIGPKCKYTGCDLIPDETTAKIVDQYIVKNALDLNTKYDTVLCISTIEHCGIDLANTIPVEQSQLQMVKKLAYMAKKRMFLTFPYGHHGIFEGHYANITRDTLDRMIEKIRGSEFETSAHFFSNEGPSQGHPWIKVTQEVADKIELDPSKGVQCVCILMAEKKNV